MITITQTENDPSPNLVHTYASDDKGEQYYIKQVETDIIYSEAYDVMPCKYTYEPTDIKIEKMQDD